MSKILNLRFLLTLIGLVLIGVLVYVDGPLFSFGDWRPLESERARWLTIVAIVVLWLLRGLIRRLRSGQLTQQLAAALSARKSSAPDLHGDALALRERFEEAIGMLKSEKRSGRNLYELPWYVIIGPPGSGKTTALVNSGLSFPLAQRFGKDSVRGVGGTRNCDWWFTNEAIFLDTAGRYTTQDSDASADGAGWVEFLNLLRKYRKRRPLNGVLVAMSVSDLLTLSAGEREANIDAVRRRLDELNRHLNITLPVYLLFTKCDLIAGFTEYFEDLNLDSRAQVWGATFAYAQSVDGTAARTLAGELDALIERLNARLFLRLEEERDVRRRCMLFSFPQQFAALRDQMVSFTTDVFEGSRFDGRLLLRGVYLTSGTQEGTPIDRLMSSLGRLFSLTPQVRLPGVSGRGKAYFIEHPLKNVILSETGLAGLNRRLELRKALLQVAAYGAMAVIAVCGVIAFSMSYARNRDYLAEVSTAVGQLPAPPAQGASLPDIAVWLDSLYALIGSAEAHRAKSTPVAMHWGLYQGAATVNAARDAYLRELNGWLLPAIGQGLQQQLVAATSDPDKLYEYLKTYLMLGEPEHLDPTQLKFLVDLEWQRAYPKSPDLRAALDMHLENLLAQSGRLRPLPLNETLVSQARTAIRQASLPRLMYSRLRLNYVSDTARALRLDEASGLGSERVLARKSGRSLATAVPSLYTRAVFDEITGLGTTDLVKQFVDDRWVLGDEGASLAGSARMTGEVLDIYEQDYQRAWDEIVNDITLVPFGSVAQTTDALAILSGPTSPLKGFLQVVENNTNLTRPKPNAGKVEGAVSAVSAAMRATQDRLRQILAANDTASGPATPRPGARVTAHFAAINKLTDSTAPGGAAIDRVLNQLGQISQQLNSVGGGIGETNALDALTRAGSGEKLRALQQQAAALPPPIGALVTSIASRSQALTTGQARGELASRYEQQVLRDCREVVNGRYPFQADSRVDVPLADFARVFGYGGVFDTFFKENLASIVDTSRAPWIWRSGASGSIAAPDSMLREFEAAQVIRDTFFRPGGQLPEVRFNVAPSYLDAGATRFVMELDGQTVEYRHGPERNSLLVWPGPMPGMGAISFEDRTDAHPNTTFAGPWALFRMLDAATVQADSDVRYRATFRAGSNEARVVIEATSIRNPFTKSALRQFRCTG
jgi:type VI secretion system protein ImpL